MGKRKFNKQGKQEVHFRLVHRTGREEEGASQHVLEPYVPPNVAKKVGPEPELPEELERALGPAVLGMDIDDGSDMDEDDGAQDLDGDCYFPKDGYDYNQHLKGCGENAVVLVAERLEKEQAAAAEGYPQQPQQSSSSSTLHVPLSISQVDTGGSKDALEALEALDATEEYEELTDDMFEVLIKGGGVDSGGILWNDPADQRNIKAGLADGEFMPELLMDDLFDDDEEDDGEAGPRAQSSAKADAELLQMLDEYDDDEIGCLSEPEDDEGEDRGKVLETCDKVAEQYVVDRDAENKKMAMLADPQASQELVEQLEKGMGLNPEPAPLEKTRALASKFLEADSDAETSEGENTESYLGISHQTEKEDWDCESILSTYSNTSNRPGRIIRPKFAKPKKTAVQPVIEEKDEKAEEDEESDDSADERAVALLDAPTERSKNETPEEKKARKSAVKALRQECRKLKKESKDTYKKEGAKLSKSQIGTADLRNQVRSFKM